ncbi:MAG: STAS domain-containing protein [Oscillospiraceae bacterium]|nr:STAS domain-containing protein [Oscillospiraceae bacterium]MDE6102916.1 STAS domain-containing protein [Oscillospiraceae bacterium]
MSVKIINEDNKIIALLSGEIDHHNAKTLRQDIDFALRENQPEELILDFSEVGFMDSSGIGLVMGRYKLMQEIGGSLIVRNPPAHIKKVMRLSGIDRLASICNV